MVTIEQTDIEARLDWLDARSATAALVQAFDMRPLAEAVPNDMHRPFLHNCVFAGVPLYTLYEGSPQAPFCFAAQRVHAMLGHTLQ